MNGKRLLYEAVAPTIKNSASSCRQLFQRVSHIINYSVEFAMKIMVL